MTGYTSFGVEYGPGPAEIESLKQIDADVATGLGSCPILDTFGQSADPEITHHPVQCFQHLQARRARLGDAPDERNIELEIIWRYLGKFSQSGLSSAEIIVGQADPESVEFGPDFRHLAEVGYGRFVDFEYQLQIGVPGGQPPEPLEQPPRISAFGRVGIEKQWLADTGFGGLAETALAQDFTETYFLTQRARHFEQSSRRFAECRVISATQQLMAENTAGLVDNDLAKTAHHGLVQQFVEFTRSKWKFVRQGLETELSRGIGSGRLLDPDFKQSQFHVADVNHISVPDWGCARDRFAVDESAVGATQIPDCQLFRAFQIDFGVCSRHPVGDELDSGVGLPADDQWKMVYWIATASADTGRLKKSLDHRDLPRAYRDMHRYFFWTSMRLKSKLGGVY